MDGMRVVEAPDRTVGAVVEEVAARLAAAGVAEPRADAAVLAAHALGTSRAGLRSLRVRTGSVVPLTESAQRHGSHPRRSTAL